MRIYITSTGDPDTGIAGQEAVVEWGDEQWPSDGGDRALIRCALRKTFADDLFNEPQRSVRVRFDDECDGCGQRLPGCACPPEE